jgi:hypothetical protein
MTLDVAQCAQWIDLALGGKPHPVLSTLQLANMAGKHLVSMTRWRYLENETTTLDTVASQAWLDLPANFAQEKSLVPVNGLTVDTVQWVTRDVFNASQAQQATSDGFTLVTVETVAGDEETPPTPRIAIYPAPASSVTGAYSLVYRAGWANVTDADNYIQVPDNAIQTLYIAVLQAFARGMQRHEKASLSLNLSELSDPRKSDLFKNALKDDRSTKTSHGRIVGAIEARRRRVWPSPGYSTGP